MLKNYFTIALRNIRRHPGYSLLNVSGMAIGLASAFLLFMWVYDEWSYDRHFSNAGNIYRIIQNENPRGAKSSLLAVSPDGLTRALKESYPEVIRATSFSPLFIMIRKGDEFIGEGIFFVDRDFLKMFDIEFVKGDINTALGDPTNVIITEKIAKKYFGGEDPVGKKLPLSVTNYVLTVTGVVKNFPHNSHIQFDFLVPREFSGLLGGHFNEWDVLDYNYIELKDGTNGRAFGLKIADFLKKHGKSTDAQLSLQNLKKIHLYSARKYTYDVIGHGDIIYVRIMGIIALFLLLIACINFMNLTTAQSARRAREIGLRKAAGAGRRKIVFQFLGESVMIVFTAQIIAMIIVELFLPAFNGLSGKQLHVEYRSAGLYACMIGVVVLCGVLAGGYPAWYLSSLRPLDALKGTLTGSYRNSGFRRILVVFQSALSGILIICTLIVAKQLNYLQNKDLGFNRENVGYIQYPSAPWDPVLITLKKELLKNPGIEYVTRAFRTSFRIEDYSHDFTWEGKKAGEDVLFNMFQADEDFAATFKLDLAEGRFFSADHPADSKAVVINETAAGILGFREPVGRNITSHGTESTIIGVVRDFHFKTLHYKIEPLVISFGGSNILYVRMKPGQVPQTMRAISDVYGSFHPASPLSFHFLKDDFDNLYIEERKIGEIAGCFSFLAIMISCLGLLGLSSYMTERRTKEIGIRKVNGARPAEMFSMLTNEYLLLVIASMFVATPVAWYAMNKWLQTFAYRTNTSLWVFAAAAALVTVVTLLTVAFQSFRASRRNPVEALRYE